jgi:hypothetical protein
LWTRTWSAATWTRSRRRVLRCACADACAARRTP